MAASAAYAEPMSPGLSRKEIEALGRALRAGDVVPGSATWATYTTYLAEQDGLRQEVENRVRSLLGTGVTITGRTKSTDTLREKLIRTPSIQLPYIRDVIGIRVVADTDLSGQDDIVEQLRAEFGDQTQIIDRRAEPESGYRAVHVIVRVGVTRAEIQVRTALQAQWADLYERLADTWGRQIRYGADPDPDAAGEVGRRRQLIHALQQVSLEFIAEFEKAWTESDAPPDSRSTQRSLRGASRTTVAAAMKAHALVARHDEILAKWRRLLTEALDSLAREADLIP